MTENPTPKKRHFWLRRLLGNSISMAGAALAIVSAANIFLFCLIDLIAEHPTPYIGILAYMVAPGFLIFGLLLIAVGAWRGRKRKFAEESDGAPKYPVFDFNDAAQRGAIISFGTFLLIFVLISSAGSYKAYEYSESTQFCGLTCHTVMHPQFTAHQLSAHARVSCVECHVGSGASWYVQAKLSGAHQVYAVAFNTYPRPTQTPVHNLRPAQDTCEQCHWPRKFYGSQLKLFTHYSSDEKNTARQIRMLIKTGGGDPATGAPEGIHWHMNIANEIEFIASDEKRQIIPYIHVKNMQGEVTEYFAPDSKLNKDQIAKAPRHRMDCIDCHNRPAHIYVPPDQAVDQALLARRLDSSLPYLKQQAVTTLTGKYDTTDVAVRTIAHDIEGFYETKYPDIARTKQVEIHNAIDEIQQVFRRTTFPEMKLNWETHPNNLGHFYFNGCFRCHDGLHVSPEGKVISKDCNICHTLMGQEEAGVSTATAPKITFQHPVELGDLTQVNCSNCHNGGVGP